MRFQCYIIIYHDITLVVLNIKYISKYSPGNMLRTGRRNLNWLNDESKSIQFGNYSHLGVHNCNSVIKMFFFSSGIYQTIA